MALLVLTGSLAAIALVLVLTTVIGRSPTNERLITPSPQNVTLPRPEATAPTAAVRPVHRALHALGRLCGSDAVSAEASSQARRPVMVILEFAHRYPNVSFPVHDETGTTLSLLFVARNEVRACAPMLAAQVERSIPPEYLTPNPTG